MNQELDNVVEAMVTRLSVLDSRIDKLKALACAALLTGCYEVAQNIVDELQRIDELGGS